MSNILITGVKGTLGTPLAKELKKRGHTVFGVDLTHEQEEGGEYIRADVANFRELEQAFQGFREVEYVYHLAAEFGRLNGELWYERLWNTNAIGTRNVIELCCNYQAKLIFASSSEIYGEGEFEGLSEDITLSNPLQHHNEYAISKWVNEFQIQNFAKQFPLQYVICRFFNAYGPGEFYHPYRSVVALFTYRALHNIGYVVYNNYYRTFMHIHDFTPTLANVCERFNNEGIYNIGGEDYRSVKELSDLVLAHTGKDDSLVSYLGEEEHNVASKRPDISKAKKDLGHNPTIKLEEGVPNTVNWMLDQYYEELT
jgi:dTDP-glucose 4,6-dehydratase